MANATILPQISRKSVAAAIRQAKVEAAHHQAWINAITKATINLEVCPWSFDGEVLRIQSATDSSTRYTVDAHGCDCRAGAKGRPCWHRAARRLLCKAAEMTPPPLRTLAEAQAAVDEIFS